MDPKILISAIDKTKLSLEYLSQKRRATIEDDLAHQVLGEEHANRAERETFIRLEESRDSLEEARRLLELTEQRVEEAHRLHTQVSETLSNAQETNLYAKNQNTFWQDQLRKATNWFESATNRLRRAEADEHVAKLWVQDCQSRLSAVRAELQAARHSTKRVQEGNDRNGNPVYRDVPVDTTSFENAVAKAEAELSDAYGRLEIARQEVLAAKEELARAKRQVHGSKQAIHDCENAVGYSQVALDSAAAAKMNSERAISDTAQAYRDAQRCLNHREQELDACNEAVKASKAASTTILEGRFHVNLAEETSDINFERSMSAMIDMEQKVENLYAFDRPVLSV